MSRRGRFGSYTVEVDTSVDVDLYEILKNWYEDDRRELFKEFGYSIRVEDDSYEPLTWINSIEEILQSESDKHIIRNRLTKFQKDKLRELLNEE